MPNNGTKKLTGDGSAIAPDDKALNEKGRNGKPGWEDAVRRNKTLNVRCVQKKEALDNKASDKKNGQQNRKTVKNDCNMLFSVIIIKITMFGKRIVIVNNELTMK